MIWWRQKQWRRRHVQYAFYMMRCNVFESNKGPPLNKMYQFHGHVPFSLLRIHGNIN